MFPCPPGSSGSDGTNSGSVDSCSASGCNPVIVPFSFVVGKSSAVHDPPPFVDRYNPTSVRADPTIPAYTPFFPADVCTANFKFAAELLNVDDVVPVTFAHVPPPSAERNNPKFVPVTPA